MKQKKKQVEVYQPKDSHTPKEQSINEKKDLEKNVYKPHI
jgi:hypothetical protein